MKHNFCLAKGDSSCKAKENKRNISKCVGEKDFDEFMKILSIVANIRLFLGNNLVKLAVIKCMCTSKHISINKDTCLIVHFQFKNSFYHWFAFEFCFNIFSKPFEWRKHTLYLWTSLYILNSLISSLQIT